MALGLGLAAVIASNLVAANARDLAVNTWFWQLGQQHAWVLDAATSASWLVDGQRNIIIVPVIVIVLLMVGLLQAPARLVVGKHWFTDVIGSWLIGSGWLLLVWAGFLWWLAPRSETSLVSGASPAM